MLTFFLKNFQFFSAAWKSSQFILIRYIAKKSENSTAFCVFLRKIYHYTNHITDLELFFGHFKLKSNPPQGGLHSPTTEVISKTSPSCVATFGKNSKKTSPHHWLSRLPPCFVTPFLNFFQKNFIPPLLTITFFLLFVSTPMLLFWKILLYHWLSQKHPVLYHPVLHFFLKTSNLHPWLSHKYIKSVTPCLNFLKNLPERE